MSSFESRQASLIARSSENVCALLNSKEHEVAAALEARRALAALDSEVSVVQFGKSLSQDARAILARTAPAEVSVAASAHSLAEQAAALRAAFDTTYKAIGVATRDELVAATDRFIKSRVADVKSITSRTDGEKVIIQSDSGGGKVATYQFELHGQFTVDRIGYEGTTCTAEQESYEAHLRAQGIFADVVQSVFHGGKRDSVFAPSETPQLVSRAQKAV